MTNKIHESFTHGGNFSIGDFCIIEEGVTVGDNVSIANYVLLKKGTVIGDSVSVDNYARSSGNNKIGNNVTIRYGATIAREVTIEDDVFISPNVMTIYSTSEGDAIGGTLIKKGAHIGTAAVLGPGITVEEDVVVGAMTYAAKDCLEPGTYFGVPARRISKG